MSGFIVAFGASQTPDLSAAAKRIRHRGRALEGSARVGRAAMYQTYLDADLSAPVEEHEAPPFSVPGDELRICFDGRIGAVRDPETKEGRIPASLGTDYAEERALLDLYRARGNELFEDVSDSVFAFAITDGRKLLAARDVLGIKPLFYGYGDGALYLASELKALTGIASEPREFPAGHYMDESGRLRPFAELSDFADEPFTGTLDDAVAAIRRIIDDSVATRVDFRRPTACLLSGGLDSSVIAAVMSEHHRSRCADSDPLKTFAVGVGESDDIRKARIMASAIGSDHHELLVTVGGMVELLPRVVYALESFDPSLVRSAVANYIISAYAAEHGIEVLLSGEGGDELFAGYTHLKKVPADMLVGEQIEVLRKLHNNASLRLDRMNQAHSIRVITPLVSQGLLELALSLPAEWKIRDGADGPVEKWIFRKAYEDRLPAAIAWNPKKEFSQGSGSADALKSFFDDKIEDAELKDAQSRRSIIRSKEELYYYRFFEDSFPGEHAAKTVGQWPDF